MGMSTNSSHPADDDFIDPQAVESAAEFAPNEETEGTATELTAWDEPTGITGRGAPKVLPEDEIPAAEQLVAEGIDEADREQRLAAEDPDFEQ